MITTFSAVDPATGAELGRYEDSSRAAVDTAAGAAAEAAADPRLAAPGVRAELLRDIARRLREGDAALHEAYLAESGLPEPRSRGELERTCVQLELFADVVEEGSWADAIIDRADPDFPVAPRPDLRRVQVPLGPVAVFAASNFPYAFGVAGGDTASALAAGCPVVAKAHPSQPRTAELVAGHIADAVAAAGLPRGTFALLQGAGAEVGEALVEAGPIEAVGFTGSLRGGRALFDLAARRSRPIPVFAEMGSVNPVVITAGALGARGDELADGLAQSVAMGTGQFCTKPGLVLAPAGSGLAEAVATRLDDQPAGVMLNERIHAAFTDAVGELERSDTTGTATAGGNGGGGDGYRHAPVVAVTSAAALLDEPALGEERFGPLVLVAEYEDAVQLTAVVRSLEGQLTATVHVEDDELEQLTEVIALLRARAGRLLFAGFPTGVAVTHAMQHGGPYPATTASGHTSVGSTALRRFLRPVAYQDAPAAVLPAALADDNPLDIWRRVDGELTRDAL